MTRRRYERKLMNLLRAIYAEEKKHGSRMELGKSMRHLHQADLRNTAEKVGGYKAMWEMFADLRRMYGVN